MEVGEFLLKTSVHVESTILNSHSVPSIRFFLSPWTVYAELYSFCIVALVQIGSSCEHLKSIATLDRRAVTTPDWPAAGGLADGGHARVLEFKWCRNRAHLGAAGLQVPPPDKR